MTPEEAISVIKTEIGQFIIDEKWKNALALAIEALEKQDVLDAISRNAAIDAVEHITSTMSVCDTTDECHGMKRMQRLAVIELENLPSAEPELTDDLAIEHLQSTGWMQNHDKEMYEMGLRERLADDSGSYDSLIPSGGTILRQAAIELANSLKDNLPDDERIADIVMAHNDGILEYQTKLSLLPYAQPEQSNASEFWRKRADFYSDMCMNLIGEMGKGVKIESVKISENGIEFIKEQPPAQPERKTGKWIGKSGSLHYCSECGWALMDNESGEPPYMGIDYHRENPERWTCCPGWNEWLMNFCPNCGADMRGEQE